MIFIIVAVGGVAIILLALVTFRMLMTFINLFVLCSSKGISARAAIILWFAACRNKKQDELDELFKNAELLNCLILDISKRKSAYPKESKKRDYLVNLLDSLYEIRQSLALKVYTTTAISSSKDLPEKLILTITVSGLRGAQYHSRILANNSLGMIVGYPTGPKLPVAFAWRGKQALVNATFNSVVFRFAMTFDSHYWDQSFSTLRLLHSDAFIQKSTEEQPLRANVRYNVHIPAMFSLLEAASPPAEREGEEGQNIVATTADAEPIKYRSVVKDLSLDSCRILVGGTVPTGLKCQLLLRLNGLQIPIWGLTQMSEFIEADDFSYVRVQFTHIEQEDLQSICSFIYGVEVAEGDVPPTPQDNLNFDESLDDFYSEGKDFTGDIADISNLSTSLPEVAEMESRAEAGPGGAMEAVPESRDVEYLLDKFYERTPDEPEKPAVPDATNYATPAVGN